MKDINIELDRWIVTISNQGYVIIRRKSNPKDEWFFYSSGDIQVTASSK